MNDFDNKGQDQRYLHMAPPFMLVIICTKCGGNPLQTIDKFTE